MYCARIVSLKFEGKYSLKYIRLSDKKNYLYHCGGPVASLQYTGPLVHWVNHLLSTLGGSGSRPRDASTLTMEPSSPVSDVFIFMNLTTTYSQVVYLIGAWARE